MKYKILILIIFSFILTYSQKVNNDTLTTKIDIPKSKTLTINLVNKTDEADIVAFDWEKNMPWIGAVLIGLLTVVANVIISRQSRKTSLKTINLQLNNNKEISLAQIETSKQTAPPQLPRESFRVAIVSSFVLAKSVFTESLGFLNPQPRQAANVRKSKTPFSF